MAAPAEAISEDELTSFIVQQMEHELRFEIEQLNQILNTLIPGARNGGQNTVENKT
ncbi:hypothetical protein LZK82_26845 (plasmid) [Rhizobium leguminosarum]|uniref:hypothetical protein n=1 Tax=Rhizobium leguminosarum TaxID=384 RepID=UPI0012BC582C|nr:hypothetical protein [Rhizobium leguminosarum]UIK01151.1 hypothetical protein LZK82_26845 [Rhizobium leguminosarum]UIK14071.1 hypothetical protein LZK80_32480 [Rhizobium leguminosarum]UIL30206.1 hypothetical protein LZK75_27185 [Rhizobium leguminosarum]WFT89468.1 hypothetical protein QA638_26910 [Rhizobium leguminosarum]WFT90841.1 hypothetical protein QA638_35550 [Rhizobium leguminosarum]